MKKGIQSSTGLGWFALLSGFVNLYYDVPMMEIWQSITDFTIFNIDPTMTLGQWIGKMSYFVVGLASIFGINEDKKI